MSYSLNSSELGYVGGYIGDYYRGYERGILGVYTIVHMGFIPTPEPEILNPTPFTLKV